MASAPLIRVQGVRETVGALRSVSHDLPKEMRSAGLAAAQTVVPAAAGRAPVRTGALRGSVRAVASQRGAAVRAGGSRAPYAGVVHFGSPKRNIKANSFLYEAADARQVTVAAVYQKRVHDLIERAGL